ncbi:hypothetical protein CANARDRAFT_54865 [[Candida] arabinofermentans NRRL YB-2248]|uniref:Uncharacterized protein n=1 Tax=[Candida] arabinofermentans NRRL YB-2248 TaxID=983967 RepID=A0A1E4T883_9ASCO|nr:hypothetical protein CANARDRAFT_54865 [[Candida] arabinofermentans NRRL YB-2248]
MDNLQGYGSDSSSSDSEVEEQTSQKPQENIDSTPKLSKQSIILPKTITEKKEPLHIHSTQRVLGSSIKNTFNDSSQIQDVKVLSFKSNTKSTDLVPTHLLRRKQIPGQSKHSTLAKTSGISKTQPQSSSKSLQDMIMKNKLIHSKQISSSESKTDTLDLFGISSPATENTKQIHRASRTIDVRGESKILQKPTVDQSTDMPEKDAEPEMIIIGKNKINVSAIKDLDMKSFYQENNKLINTGELDHEEFVNKHARANYYQDGNNNLSSIVKFTESNKDKLARKVEQDMAKMGNHKK